MQPTTKSQEPGFRIEVPPDLAQDFGLSETPPTGQVVVVCQRPVQVRPAIRHAA